MNKQKLKEAIGSVATIFGIFLIVFGGIRLLVGLFHLLTK